MMQQTTAARPPDYRTILQGIRATGLAQLQEAAEHTRQTVGGDLNRLSLAEFRRYVCMCSEIERRTKKSQTFAFKQTPPIVF